LGARVFREPRPLVGCADSGIVASGYRDSGIAIALRLGFCILMSLMALCLNPAFAQEEYSAPDTGRIHGRVISPTGQPQNGGVVGLSTNGGETLTYSFPVSPTGTYAGEATLGEYTLIYRAADTPEGKVVDYIQGVVILAGKDVAQDDDMTRPEYMERLSPEQQKQIQEMRAASTSAAAASNLATSVNVDLDVVNRDLQDAGKARVSALEVLGKDATLQDIDAKTAEIANGKYTEIETLMTKDTASDPTEPIVWIDLARAQSGLKNYLDAETNFKKALDLESKAQPPQPQIMGAIEGGLGEVYARTLMVDEANAAFDAAAKADPADAALYLENQAIIFFQLKNASAQVDAADKAIKADPANAFLYFIKAQGLAQDAPFDPNSDKSILSPECIAAFRKYLELAPNGPFAAEVNTVLERSEEKASTPAPAATK
jgi:tetratricopeptide (TPR) repeat protein